MSIPSEGMSATEIASALTGIRQQDPPVHGGRVLAYVYDAGVAESSTAGLEALGAFAEVNALDPTTFPSVARIENDLVVEGHLVPVEIGGRAGRGGDDPRGRGARQGHLDPGGYLREN